MPNSEEARYEEQARKTLEEDIHYLTTLTQMADSREVVAREEVFTATGMKLLDRGVAIGSGLRERLLQHVLLKPIDQSLEVKGGVTAALLAQEGVELIALEPYLRRLLAPAGTQACKDALLALNLPAQLGFKLTVAHDQQPGLYKHLLAVALLSHFLACQRKLSASECSDALLAGLVHDIGELHTDPALLDRDHRLREEELRYVDVHPITGYLIARETLPSRPAVATAVLQHQEKLDGSGYPYGLRGEAIHGLGRIVSLADACASILARFHGSERLSTLMRLNRQKFDPALIHLLQQGLSHEDDSEAASGSVGLEQIQAAAQLLLRWAEFAASLPAKPPSALAFLFERMADLRVMLLQFGLDPSKPESLHALCADTQIASELAAVLDEVRWQFADLERETLRRRDAIAHDLPSAGVELLDAWLAEIRACLHAGAPADLLRELQR